MKTYRCHIEVTVVPTTKPQVLVIYAAPNTTVAGSIQAACSQRKAKVKVVGIYKTGTVSLDINMADFFGVDKETFGDTLYGSSVGTNPSAICYVTVESFNLDATAVNAVSMFAKVRLYTIFNSPNYLAISLSSKEPHNVEKTPKEESKGEIVLSPEDQLRKDFEDLKRFLKRKD